MAIEQPLGLAHGEMNRLNVGLLQELGGSLRKTDVGIAIVPENAMLIEGKLRLIVRVVEEVVFAHLEW